MNAQPGLGNSLNSMEGVASVSGEMSAEVLLNLRGFSDNIKGIVTGEIKKYPEIRTDAILKCFSEYRDELEKGISTLGIDGKSLDELKKVVNEITRFIIIMSVSNISYNISSIDNSTAFSEFFTGNYTDSEKGMIIYVSKQLAGKALVKAGEKAGDIGIEDKGNELLYPKVEGEEALAA